MLAVNHYVIVYVKIENVKIKKKKEVRKRSSWRCTVDVFTTPSCTPCYPETMKIAGILQWGGGGGGQQE